MPISYSETSSVVSSEPSPVPAVPAWKPCNGPAPRLAPLKFSHLQRVSTLESVESAASAPTPTPTGPPKYTPPSLRRVMTDGDVPYSSENTVQPKTLSTNQLSSEELFPALGAKPAPKAATAGSWTQLRSRFGAPESKAEQPTPPATPSSSNAFAALDDEQQSVATAKSGSLNYGVMIQGRIQKDAEEKELEGIAETDDPLEMSHQQLQKEGWGILNIPKDARVYLQQLLSKQQPLIETLLDPEEEYFRNEETWERLDIVRQAMNEFTNPEGFLKRVMKKSVHLPPLELQSQLSPRPEFLEPLAQVQAVKPVRLPPIDSFKEVLQRKRETLAAARAAAAAAAATVIIPIEIPAL